MSEYIQALLRSLCKCGHNGYSHWSQHDSACQEPGCSCKKFDREVSERLQEISAKLLRNTYCDDSRQNESGDLIGALFAEIAVLEERNKSIENQFYEAVEEAHERDVMQEKRIAELTLEAQTHAQEARTANATIAEIYQVCTGSTGEPGNWNGAKPVRELIKAKEAEIERLWTALKNLLGFMSSGDCETEFEKAVKEAEDAVKVK